MFHRSLKSSFTILCVLTLLFSLHTIVHSSTTPYQNTTDGLNENISTHSSDVVSALNALADPIYDGKTEFYFMPVFPRGTEVLNLQQDADTITIEFSPDILGGGLSEDRLQAIFEQVRFTLGEFGIDGNLCLSTGGRLLSDYLPTVQRVTPSLSPRMTPQGQFSLQTTGKLNGHSVTVSPGHGVYWTGNTWTTQRGVTGAPLTEEDFHVLDICQYLETYLKNEGLTVNMVRCTDKNYGNSVYSKSGVYYPWWKMASSYWLKYQGYPKSVYASYDGSDLATGWNDSSNDIRARPLASDYDGSDIYVSVHTNAFQGDVYVGGPTGTESYYDSSSEHAAWGSTSQTLATYITTSVIDMIDSHYDPTWTSHGQAVKDSNGAYGEIRIPKRPAMLLELAYHDTCDRDAVYLRDNFFRSTAMWGMYKGICDYFGVIPTWGFYSCEYVSDTIPATMSQNQQCQASITLRNRGVLWTEAQQIRLGAVGESDPFIGQSRQTISGEVGPNDTCTFTFTMTAPSTAGSYVTDWRMVRDGHTWFGPTVSKTVTVGVDNAAPVISNVRAEDILAGSVDIKWTTDEASTSQAQYGLTSAYSTTYPEDTTQTTDHVMHFTNLAPNTTYHYRVGSYDNSRNMGLSGDYTFTTAAFDIPQDIIIDNVDSGYTKNGVWTTSTSAANKYATNYYWANTTDTGAFSTWTPNIAVPGYYDVYCWYSNGTNRSTQARWETTYKGGSMEVRVNEQATGGQWVLIASAAPFDVGTSGYVRTYANTGDASSMVVIADAVKFVYVNTFAPRVEITTPTTGSTYSTNMDTIDLVGTSASFAGITSVTWANDRGGSGTCAGASPWSANNIALQPGSNVITITATDATGSRGTCTLTVNYTDTAPPTVKITVPTSASTYSTTSQIVLFRGTAADDRGVSSVSWANDRGGSDICSGTTSWSKSIKFLPGMNVITITATDAAGNKGTATITVNYTDITPPTLTITSPTSASTYSATTDILPLGGTASDNCAVSSVSWSNDRGGNGTCSGTTSWSRSIKLLPGTNVITLTATDAAGNKGTAILTVHTDSTPPTVKITVPTTASTYSTTSQIILFRGTAADDRGVSSVSWANNRGGVGTCSGTTSWSRSIKFMPGVNVITITATDTFGNKGTATITVDYTDITPPTVNVTVPTTASTYAATSQIVLLRGTAADNGTVTSVSWSNDRGGSGLCSGTTYWSRSIRFMPGVNVITLIATDSYGNTGTSTLTVNYTDVSPPTVKITMPTTASAYSTTSQIVLLRGTAADNGTVASVSWSNDRGGSGICSGTTYWSRSIKFLPGVNVITLTAADSAGNTGTASITVTYNDPTVRPTTYYVATNGSDSNPGSLSQPWRTLGHGMTTIAMGDTLYVRGGTYPERVDISGKIGNSSAVYTVKNYPGETPIMDAAYNDNISVAMKFVNSSYWYIEGFCIRNYTGAGIWLADRSSHIDIFRNLMYNFNEPQIQGSGVEAILIAGDTADQAQPSYITIKGNCMSNVGLKFNTQNDHGIYMGYGANNIVVDANRIYNCSGSGIQMYGTTGVSNCTLTNNVIYNNNTWGLVMWDNGTGNYVTNNTFYGNPCDLDINEGASGAYFQNNIFGSNTATYLIVLRDAASNNNTFNYNCYYSGNGYPIYKQGNWKTFEEWQGYGQEANGRNGDPKFIDAANGNFRVAGSSTCLGMGMQSGVQYDFAGTLRETTWMDMGAYDYNYSYDLFDGQSKNTYTPYGGSWSLTGTSEYAYQQTTYSGSAKRTVFYDFPATADSAPNNWASNKNWTNYLLDADVKMTGSGPYYNTGLVARTSSDGNTYYVAIMYTSQVDLWKVVNGIWTQLGTAPGTYNTDTWYHLTLACSGSNIALAVNGSGKINASDTSITSGYPGMFTDYCAKFKNFKVAPY